MAQRITYVAPASPAHKAGIRPGDQLLSIGNQPVKDFLDYQAFTAEKRVEMLIRRNGETRALVIRKGEYDPLGLEFEKPMMSGMHMCCNHCLFCFVDQLPDHVRPSMRVKDDDWRMSMMMGNYVTLTNVSDAELDRIIARHASPLYISVHAADPDLRSRILGQNRGKKLMQQLKKLSDGGIEFHTQAVLCPGINDGAALEDTIARLANLSGALSLALVPVGLTGHRQGLYPLKPYTRDQARDVICIANRWREKLLADRGSRFVFPSDEFYLQAEMDLPADEEYEDYGQIDDGVGLLRLLETEFHQAWQDLPEADRRAEGEQKQLIIACGVSAAPFLQDLIHAHPITGLCIRVIGVINRFFGETVTVSGLVTGGDLSARIRDEAGEKVFITECMLRNEGDKFLDDMPLEEAERIIGRPIIPVGRRGDELLCALMDAR